MRFFTSVSACALIAMTASCGAGIDLSIRPDRSATIALSVEVPVALDAKIRQFAGGASGSTSGQSIPLFDAKAIEASLRSRNLIVKESSSPSTRSYRGVFTTSNLASLLAGDARLSEAIRYERGAGWASLRVHVDKGNAAAVADLFPGLDPDLIESLQPPALYDNPVTVEEYRSMLAGLLGRTAAASLDDLSLVLTVSLPGAIIESSGTAAVRAGKQPGASVEIRALDAMVLSKPIEFYLKWAE
jgi:hypothetical protein